MEMNVHFTNDNQFTDYSEYSVTIKQKQYNSNIMVTNTAVYDFKSVDNVEQILFEDLEQAIQFNPDLIIFGTGRKVIFPKRTLIRTLQDKAIGVEVMPIQALCRTYNFLVSENRKVVGIILFLPL